MNKTMNIGSAGSLVACLLLPGFEHPTSGQTRGTGTIVGTVRLAAQAPPNRLLRMGSDPACAEINRGKQVYQETVRRGPDGGLANVFVSLQGKFPSVAQPTEPVRIDQRGCLYTPRVQGARVGQQLLVLNSDETLHSIHSQSRTNAFNVSQPKAGMTYRYVLKAEEVMLHVRCDLHSWMTGYVGIVTHPYFAVSGDMGTFRIPNVPSGRQTVQAWHELYGPLMTTVDVVAGKSMRADFTYSGSEKPAPPKGFAAQELAAPGEGTVARLVLEPAHPVR